jgi:hypothetical protein
MLFFKWKALSYYVYWFGLLSITKNSNWKQYFFFIGILLTVLVSFHYVMYGEEVLEDRKEARLMKKIESKAAAAQVYYQPRLNPGL